MRKISGAGLTMIAIEAVVFIVAMVLLYSRRRETYRRTPEKEDHE